MVDVIYPGCVHTPRISAIKGGLLLILFGLILYLGPIALVSSWRVAAPADHFARALGLMGSLLFLIGVVVTMIGSLVHLSGGAHEEVARAKLRDNLNTRALTVKELCARAMKLALASKILRWLGVSDLAILGILWILRLQNLFFRILALEALVLLFYGVFLIVSTYIARPLYQKDSIPPDRRALPPQRSAVLAPRTGWLDYKRFAELTLEERQRYRLEGKVMIVVGLALLTALILHFFITQ